MLPGASAHNVAGAIDHVLAAGFLRNLGRLRLGVRRAAGPRPGNTPVRHAVQPTGLEFERHKSYGPGDEPRHIDWNAYARSDDLLVKQFRAEREAPLHVFVDASASMGVPGADGKLPFAVGLALSFAYVALRHNDPVRIVALGEHFDAHAYVATPALRLPLLLQRLAAFCAALEPAGQTRLDGGIGAYLQRVRFPGLAVVISDFLVPPESWRHTLRHLRGRGFEVVALRPLGAHEREPSRAPGPIRLRDAETGAERTVRLTAAHVERYRRALEDHLEATRRTCDEGGAWFAACDTAAGIDACLFSQLTGMGVLR